MRVLLRANLVYLAKVGVPDGEDRERIHTFDVGRVPKRMKAGRLRASADTSAPEIDGAAQVIGIVRAEC